MTAKEENNYFNRREFSFTLPGDIYIRYQSFKDGEELKKALQSKNPIKIDIGAVFSGNPRDAKKGINGVKAIERELIFDIDMTDYDEVRTCCKGADLCKKCWPFLSLAAQILNDSLRKDFGFKNLLWVFSGRRGIHCWVCDQKARTLSIDARGAIADYLQVVEGGQFMAKKVTLPMASRGLDHPLIKRSLNRIDHVFESFIVNDQNIFGNRKRLEEIISWAANKNLREALQDVLNHFSNSKKGKDIWKEIVKVAQGFGQSNNIGSKSIYPIGDYYLAEVKLQLCYPRLDINVSKGVNHLLKAPFCIHPKTGKVCVPFDIRTVDKFDPSTVPSVKDVVTQYENMTEGDGPFNMRTDMKKSYELFDKFLSSFSEERVLDKKNNNNSIDF